MPRAIFVKANPYWLPGQGGVTVRDENPSYEEVREFVGGDVERIVIEVRPGFACEQFDLDEPRVMVALLNEDGDLMDLPYNRFGTILLAFTGRKIRGNIVLLDGFDLE